MCHNTLVLIIPVSYSYDIPLHMLEEIFVSLLNSKCAHQKPALSLHVTLSRGVPGRLLALFDWRSLNQ